ncbi:torsin-1A-like [Magallana gigas]|uniref:torsin-1A-like n=1 Tax=Magallana gigas TaxID=29159 RepID=UPI00333EB409
MTRNPSKALALSFHGGPGTGKNYVSTILADSIFKKGMRSKYVHLISAAQKYSHEDNRSVYKDILKVEVENGAKQCHQSLFIIDDIDKMPAGILDILKPYLTSYRHLNGINYRQLIFLFLSNTAAESITKLALDQWQTGSERTDIKLKEMEDMISTVSINSGFYHSDIIYRHMISAYIPFLPLERRHIKQCIRDFLVAKLYYKREEIPENKVSEIAGKMTYYPKDVEVFSVYGCKRIEEKVILLIG